MTKRAFQILLGVFVLVLLEVAQSADAALIAVLGNTANDDDGLEYLGNVLGITGLDLLAKEDIGGGFEGSIDEADWMLNDTGRTGTWTINDATVEPTFFLTNSMVCLPSTASWMRTG